MSDHEQVPSHEDTFGDWDDDMEEPVGSCDNCSVNVYADDNLLIDGVLLCSQCAWFALGSPGPQE